MSRKSAGGVGPWLAALAAFVALMLGATGWLLLYGVGARKMHVAMNAPASRVLPGLPQGPQAPPLPSPRPPS
jgi:hypothetical protein